MEPRSIRVFGRLFPNLLDAAPDLSGFDNELIRHCIWFKHAWWQSGRKHTCATLVISVLVTEIMAMDL